MHKIIISNECGCFKRSDLNNNIEVASKDDALITALNMSKQMNEEFCKKHDFFVSEEANNFVISFKKEEVKSSCCGGGCH